MAIPSTRQGETRTAGRGGTRLVVVLGTVLATTTLTPAVFSKGPDRPRGARFYSTAEAPRDYHGPRPTELALGDVAASQPHEESTAERQSAVPNIAPTPPPAVPAAEAPRVASTAGASARAPAAEATPSARPSTPPPATATPAPVDPIALAKQAIAECQQRYRQVQDYTCTFLKRERIGGRMTGLHVMTMKARTSPHSLYFKFQQPNRGREAIFIAGRNGNRVLAHDVGIGKVLAGTMRLDPRGSMAMEDNRHPITEAGLGHLIDTVARHWAVELSPEASQLTFEPNMQVGGHPCTMIESVHPRRHPSFLFYKVKLYIDHEHGLPIRFEAYDWPKHPGAAPELIEEYTYMNLRTNVGLRDIDFDTGNKQYSFGRF